MNILLCEMCGGNDFIEKKEYFICKYCEAIYLNNNCTETGSKDTLKKRRKEYKKDIEKIIREIQYFGDSIIIHGVINNTIAFNKSGLILLIYYGKHEIFIIQNIKSIILKLPKKDDFPQLFYFLMKTNEDKEYKMLLTVGSLEKAAIKYKKIENEFEKFMDITGDKTCV